jgi:hypothetical protein
MSLLSTSCRILSNILLSRLTPYADEIIVDCQRGFHCNRSMSCQNFYIKQILEKKWEYNGTVHQLFIDYSKPCDSVGGKFGIPRKLLGLIKMSLNDTVQYSLYGKKYI